ncbi:restriction endonuclease subunit S [Limosilactobacillus galli]|uniref:restriction endonuclease subunit S n=1 Tax=Limosilactobacillus galli TaxID=2991834 RepID=UPI0024BBC997|nr:restriction endonuclease subunit S [Limosilactobacillus galli]
MDRYVRPMKDSGIEWIGKIPQNWLTSKIKFYLYRREPRNPGNMPVLSVYRDYGVVPKDSRNDNHNVTSYDTSNYKYVTIGDLVINKMKAWQGSLAVSAYTGIVSPAYYVYHFKNTSLNRKYFHYLIRNCYKDEFKRLSTGIRDGQWDLQSYDFENTTILIPPLKEQQLIIEFLDKKCGQIDKLLVRINDEIERLKVYRNSLIIRTVTKGLDLNVSMKDSGIDWVGKIPKQWLTSKIKFYLYRNEPRNPGNVQVLSVYREYGVVPKDSRDDNHNVTSSDTSNYKYVTKGDLVINKMKAWQGSLAVSEYIGVVSPAYYVYHFKNAALDKKYFHYLIRNCYRDEFRRLSTGIRDGQWDLQAYDFENTSILVPPLKEQQQITNFLDKKCKYISNLIAEKRKQLNLLKEYKNSLIYEYVTGKKQVPMM